MCAVRIARCVACEAYAIWRVWYLGIIIFAEMLKMWHSWRSWSCIINLLAAHERRHEFLQLINAIVYTVGRLWLLSSWGASLHKCAR
jgi:hypothetical protein